MVAGMVLNSFSGQSIFLTISDEIVNTAIS